MSESEPLLSEICLGGVNVMKVFSCSSEGLLLDLLLQAFLMGACGQAKSGGYSCVTAFIVKKTIP